MIKSTSSKTKWWRIVGRTIIALYFFALVLWAYWGFTRVQSMRETAAWASFVLSTIAIYITAVHPFLSKPRFALFKVAPQWSEPPQPSISGSWFVRLGVENYGWTAAEGCVGRLVDVWTADGEQLSKFDPLTLYWARQNRANPFNPITIQGGSDIDYLDVLQVTHERDESIGSSAQIHRFRVVADELTRGPNGSPSPGTQPRVVCGTYYVRLSIHTNSAGIDPIWFKLVCREWQADELRPDLDSLCQISREKPSWHSRTGVRSYW